MKKLFFLLAMMLVCCSLFADPDCKINGLYYNLNTSDKTAQVTNKNGGGQIDGQTYYAGDMVIPSTILYDEETYTVTSIGECAFMSSSITSITIVGVAKQSRLSNFLDVSTLLLPMDTE